MKYVPGQDTKKSLGQHWLHDDNTLDSIVSAAKITRDDTVLEIGPGLGTLTQKLADSGANIVALEFDQDLIKGLTKNFNDCDNVAIIEGDIRSFDFSKLPDEYKIVANIPYYLTSNLIRSISETNNPPQIAVLLIQKEVAERICAKPGKMGILSVSAQLYFECYLDIEVPAHMFTPAPKVDSQVVVLSRRTEKLFNIDDDKFFQLVKAGFLEKRKTLRNSLSSGLHKSKEEIENLLRSANIKETSRAQELSLQQWYELYLNYYES